MKEEICRYGHTELCKGKAELVNKWNVPMCEPCHGKWVKVQLTERGLEK